MQRRFRLLLALGALSIAACGSDPAPSQGDDDDDAPDSGGKGGDDDGGAKADSSTSDRKDGGTTDAGTKDDAGGGGDSGSNGGDRDPDAKAGEFTVELVAENELTNTPAHTTFLGAVYDAPTLVTTKWTKRDEANGCVLSVPAKPFCEEDCLAAGKTCTVEGVCRSAPVAKSVGTVTVKGVKTSKGALEFKADVANNKYQTVDELPYPPFAEGDKVEIEASGGDVDAFKLEGEGIATLEVMGSDADFELKKGKDFVLKWSKPKQSGTRVQVKMDISHHGPAILGVIECDVEDNGMLTIPSKLVDGLLNLGYAGFPSVVLGRSSITSTKTSVGRVDLKIHTYVETFLSIEGLVSCTDTDSTEGCPSGQVCGEDNACHPIK